MLRRSTRAFSGTTGPLIQNRRVMGLLRHIDHHIDATYAQGTLMQRLRSPKRFVVYKYEIYSCFLPFKAYLSTGLIPRHPHTRAHLECCKTFAHMYNDQHLAQKIMELELLVENDTSECHGDCDFEDHSREC